MGQATQRKQLHQQTLAHLKKLGADSAVPQRETNTQWLAIHFVRGLAEAAGQDGASWQNRVYLEAQRHLDPDVRQGIRILMNDVLTGGLESGRVVFALQTEVTLNRPEYVGEFDTCEPLARWVAAQLKVPLHNVRVRYSRMMVPARAGLFGLKPTLELIMTNKVLGERPTVITHSRTSADQCRQRLTFLVSVFTSQGVELDHLTPAAPAPTFQLQYWGPKDSTPDQAATVTPLHAWQLFDALQMHGFWENMQQAGVALAPLRDAAFAAAAGETPVVVVSEHLSADSRNANLTELWVRWRDVPMQEARVYSGNFATDFAWQLERLGVRVERVPGLLPVRIETQQLLEST